MMNLQSVLNKMDTTSNKYGVVLQPLVAARLSASERSEMVTQYLFGDILLVEKEDSEFYFVTSLYDNYSGWVCKGSIHLVGDVSLLELKTTYMSTAQLADVFNLSDRSIIRLPLGSRLIGYNELNGRFGINGCEYQIHPSFVVNTQPASLEGILETAFSFKNAPYLWGGKTTLGIDCSGFVQQVYAIHGFELPRDARQQVEVGSAVDTLADAKQGDLLFFSSTVSSDISHVGLFLDSNRVIHASINVHVDSLDDVGIINKTTGSHSHLLKAIRRL